MIRLGPELEETNWVLAHFSWYINDFAGTRKTRRDMLRYMELSGKIDSICPDSPDVKKEWVLWNSPLLQSKNVPTLKELIEDNPSFIGFLWDPTGEHDSVFEPSCFSYVNNGTDISFMPQEPLNESANKKLYSILLENMQPSKILSRFGRLGNKTMESRLSKELPMEELVSAVSFDKIILNHYIDVPLREDTHQQVRIARALIPAMKIINMGVTSPENEAIAEEHRLCYDCLAIWHRFLEDEDRHKIANVIENDVSPIPLMKSIGKSNGVEAAIEAYFDGVPIDDLLA